MPQAFLMALAISSLNLWNLSHIYESLIVQTSSYAAMNKEVEVYYFLYAYRN